MFTGGHPGPEHNYIYIIIIYINNYIYYYIYIYIYIYIHVYTKEVTDGSLRRLASLVINIYNNYIY